MLFGCRKRCCPCCRPKTPTKQKTDPVVPGEPKVPEKDIQYGFINIFPGVRAAGHKYTSPILSIHRYHQSQPSQSVPQNTQQVSAGKSNRSLIAASRETAQEKTEFTADEEVIMVPIEDVTHITCKSYIKKVMESNSTSTTSPVYEMSENCWDRRCNCLFPCFCPLNSKVEPVAEDTTTISRGRESDQSTNFIEEHLPLPKSDEGCCSKLFSHCRCWCCRKKMLVDLIKRTNVSVDQQATRVIKVSLAYSRFSHPDSASNARLLSREEQEKYYKTRFEPDTPIDFYLVTDTEASPNNFVIKRQQAGSLCQTVMQLKAMAGSYPIETELDSILDQPVRRTYGDVYNEPKLLLSVGSQGQPQLPSSQLRAIEQ